MIHFHYIPIFTGKSLNNNPYLPFNNAIRRLTLAQGVDGEELLHILDKVEKMGGNTFTNELLKDLITVKPKAEEFNKAVNAALLSWTSGIAQGLVQHNVANGLDAWMKIYHRYIPLASDLQDILIRELYDLKLVTEGEIDSFFDDVARINEFCIKAGPSDDLSDRRIKSAVLRNLPTELVKHMAFELKKADSIEDIQSLITIYLHDPITGLVRGQPGPLICLTAQEEADKDTQHAAAPDKAEAQHAENIAAEKPKTHTGAQQVPDSNLNASKGSKKGKGNGKGYGECWHCGQWGHLGRKCQNYSKKRARWPRSRAKGKAKERGKRGIKGIRGLRDMDREVSRVEKVKIITTGTD